MIHHVLRFRFRPAVPAETREGLIAELRALEDLPAVQALVVGACVATPPDEYSHAVMITLSDERAYRDYVHHPRVCETEVHARPHLESVVVFDIADPADAGLPARLARIRMERP